MVNFDKIFNASYIKNHILGYDGHKRCKNLKIYNINISYFENYHVFEIKTNNTSKLIELLENDLEQYNYEFNDTDIEDMCSINIYNLHDDI